MDKEIPLQVAQLNINNAKIPLYEGVNTIGRNKEAVAILRHMSISQNHAVVVILDGQHFISDLKSSNGSFCGDARMVPFKLYRLTNNCKVILGGLTGTYISEGPFSDPFKPPPKPLMLNNTQSFYGCNTQLLECSAAPPEDTTNLHEEPTQEISWAAVKSLGTKSDHLGGFMDLSDHYNDENLPLQEHYDDVEDVASAATNKKTSRYEEPTQVMDVKKSRGALLVEDDESTDCEVAEIMKAPRPVDDDEATDCEDDEGNCEKIKSPPKAVEVDDASNDSMEFLNTKASFDDEEDKEATAAECDNSDSDNFAPKRLGKSQTSDKAEEDKEATTAECDNSDSDSFAPKLRRKSAMIIATQESDSETEIEVPPPDCFEDSIPATQYQSITEFNDSDIVPATQDVAVNVPRKNQGSSEESFKLGLTELMTIDRNDSEKENGDICDGATQKIPVTPAVAEDRDVYEAPTQKMVVKDDDTFLAPTQKVVHNSLDIYDAPTQAVVDETFLAPTQKVTHSKPELFQSIPEEEDLFDAPTQAVSDDTFLAPTQEFTQNRPKLFESIAEEVDLFDAPTQAASEDTFLAPTQKLAPARSTFEAETEIFEAATQKINSAEAGNPDLERQDTKNTAEDVSSDRSEAETADFEPQDANHVAEQAPIVPKLSEAESSDLEHKDTKPAVVVLKPPEGEETPATRTKAKKTFNFKKKSCNLDASLTSVLVDKKSDVARPVRMSATNKTHHAETSAERSTLNLTSTEANKSVAILEAKITRTRKSRQAPEVQVSVPKSRRSKSLLKIDETTLDDSKRIRQPAKPKEASKRAGTRTRQRTEAKATSAIKVEDSGDVETIKSISKTSKPKSQRTEAKATSAVKVEDSGDGSSVEITSKKSKPKSTVKVEDLPAVSSNKLQVKRRKPSSDGGVASGASMEAIGSPSKKRKLQVSEAVSPERGLRKQRPKVVFTMMESPQLESLIKHLGGSVVDSVEACTVLVTEHVKRSQKLLSAIGLGRPICSPKWITDSKKSQEFLDPWDYILTDPEAEKKWKFSLKESLKRSNANKLLSPYSFHIQVTNGADVLKGAIESCGGKWLSKIPSTPLDDAYIVSTPDNKSKFNRIVKKHPHFKVIEAEAIFDGVLRQELRFSRHIIK